MRRLRLPAAAIAMVVALAGGCAEDERERRGDAPETVSSERSARVDPAASRFVDPGGVRHFVRITGRRFSPSHMLIDSGEQVTFINGSRSRHRVVAAGFETRTLAPGESQPIVFRAPGTYRYRCTLHPGERGVLRVRGRSGSRP